MSLGTTTTHQTAARRHDCLMCGQLIEKGEKYARVKGKWEGEWQNWGAHEVCYAIYPAGEGVSPDEGWRGVVDLAKTTELLEAFLERFPPKDDDDGEYAMRQFGIITHRAKKKALELSQDTETP